MDPIDSAIKVFRELVWDFYHSQGRDLPWRHDPSPYQVFVSEIMLQQTQVSRVLERYPRWLRRFPSFEVLAAASVAEVLKEWQGMGYNRRALWLRSAAQMVMNEYGGVLPRDVIDLTCLPGVGPHTAGSMAAFAYDEPTVFIETNIRRVFIHHYQSLVDGLRKSDSSGQRTSTVSSGEPISIPALTGEESSFPTTISDKELRPLVETALDREHPREWYYALMDYGADLAKRVPNPNRRSKHYVVQSKFEGSVRQLRGEVLRQLLTGTKAPLQMQLDDGRLPEVLLALEKDGFIVSEDGVYRLAR